MYKEKALRRLFFPMRVKEYTRRYSANTETSYRDFSFHANGNLKIKSLSPYQRKLLSLYTTLSHSNNIIFHLHGLGPQEAENVCSIVKEKIKDNGAAILIDGYDDLKHLSNKFIMVEYNKHGKTAD